MTELHTAASRLNIPLLGSGVATREISAGHQSVEPGSFRYPFQSGDGS